MSKYRKLCLSTIMCYDYEWFAQKGRGRGDKRFMDGFKRTKEKDNIQYYFLADMQLTWQI